MNLRDLAKRILDENTGVSLSILDSEWFYYRATDFADKFDIDYSASVEDIAKSISPKQMEVVVEEWLYAIITLSFSYDFGVSINI